MKRREGSASAAEDARRVLDSLGLDDPTPRPFKNGSPTPTQRAAKASAEVCEKWKRQERA